MKKLLLSLGAVAAVAAPVAAVVACGSNDSVDLSAQKATALKSLETLDGLGNLSPEAKATATKAINAATTTKEINAALAAATTAATPETEAQVKAELGAMVKDILAQTKYAMDDAEQTRLVEKLFALDGAKDLKVLDALHGLIESEATHGADDFMVLIGGSDHEDFTGKDGFSVVRNEIFKTDPSDTVGTGLIGDVIDKDTATLLETRWAEPENEVKDANFVLYLQHDGISGKVTVQLSRVVKFGDEHFELACSAASVKGQANGKDYNNEFALSEFKATHA